jgi:3-hydroxyanthranilate 3,4-dioxygenase
VSVQIGPVAQPDGFTVLSTERWFYQLQGELTLEVQDDDATHALVLQEGDVFLLPAHLAHRIARPAVSEGIPFSVSLYLTISKPLKC